MKTEYDVKDDPCAWCEQPLGRYSLRSWDVWVHRTCDAWVWENPDERLGPYIDKVQGRVDDL